MEIVKAHRILDWIYFPHVVNMKISLPLLVLLHSLATLKEENLTFLLLPDFSLSNWAYMVPPSLAELVEVLMRTYFTVPSEQLHSLSSTSKLSVNCTLAPTQSFRIFFKFSALRYQCHHSNHTEKHLCSHLLFHQQHKL